MKNPICHLTIFVLVFISLVFCWVFFQQLERLVVLLGDGINRKLKLSACLYNKSNEAYPTSCDFFKKGNQKSHRNEQQQQCTNLHPVMLGSKLEICHLEVA